MCLNSQKLWWYFLNQKPNHNYTGTTFNTECTRRKKEPVEKRNTGGSIRGYFRYKLLWWSLIGGRWCVSKTEKWHPTTWPRTSTSTGRALLKWCGVGAGGSREQLSRFSFSDLIISFSSILCVLLFPLLHLSVSSLLFYSFFCPSLLLPQRGEQMFYVYTSLFLLLSFSLHWFLSMLV